MSATRVPRAAADEPSQDGSLLLAMVRLVDLAARPFQEGIGRRHRLGLSEWRVLAALHAHPDSPATRIARLTGLDKMTVSRALAALETAGRVARRPDPDDGRRVLAAPTPAGRQLLRSLRGQTRAWEDAIVGALSAPERRRLAAMIERMAEATAEADADDPPR